MDTEVQKAVQQEVRAQVNQRLGEFKRDQQELVRKELGQFSLDFERRFEQRFEQRIKTVENESGAIRQQIERLNSHVETEHRVLQLKIDTLTMTTGKMVKIMEGGHDGTLSMVARIRLLEDESKELKASTSNSGKLARELLVGSMPVVTGAVLSGVFWLIYMIAKSGVVP
jgi:hypothetical protein